MANALLVLNAGSSSLKFSVFIDEAPPRPLVRGQIEALGTHPRFVARAADGAVVGEQEWQAALGHEEAIEHLLAWGQGVLADHRLVAVGHRVVHGGTRFARPVLVDGGVLEALRALIPLAPLHQPHNLAAIEAMAQRQPGFPQVACFDTAFHRTQPVAAQAFALPRHYFDAGVRRYGFHGLSYEYVSSVLARLDPGAAAGKVVIAHLGNGASLCALDRGCSVASTMSFSTLDGLVMGTRCGALDPGVILYLMQREGLDARALEELLYRQSGLFGVSGGCSDMRALLARSDDAAADAVELFVYRLGRELGSLAAALGGLDALVFTGGIGENAAPIRSRVCRAAAWLDLDLDEEANTLGGPCISQAQSRVVVWVIPTDEELMIALHTRRLLAATAATAARAGQATANDVR